MEHKQRYLTALTIAGSDSGGGAGIQADLKTFSSLGVFGISVITAITAQNTREVRSVSNLSSLLIKEQLETVLSDISIDAIKAGMLPTPEIIEVFANAIDTYKLNNIIIDPVMVATTGTRLTTLDIVQAYREYLFPRLTLITPNILEAEVLSGIKIHTETELYKAGEELLKQGCNAVLIKGGHRIGEKAADILLVSGHPPVTFSIPFIKTTNLHGTGCTLSSAIASFLAMGNELMNAVHLAKQYMNEAISTGKNIQFGSGYGPVNHFFNPQPSKTKNI